FQLLGPNLYLYDPPPLSSSQEGLQTVSATVSPDLIILCTWMAAAPKHILKYTARYLATHPSTRLLLLTTSLSDMTTISNYTQESRLAPALPILRSAITNPSSPGTPKVLLHVFSNGGTHTSARLAHAYASSYSSPLLLAGIALDSCPGAASYGTGLAAMTAGLPRSMPFPLRWGAVALIHLALVTMMVGTEVFGIENAVGRLRRENLDAGLFELRKGGKRVYLYGPGDAMVEWRDVEAHAEEAKGLGCEIRLERFEGTGHVSHVVREPERYWGAVEDCW
ncbi:hypothetical protein K402DRAFT_304558, partial [Aulographum hederae CBS 113979]